MKTFKNKNSFSLLHISDVEFRSSIYFICNTNVIPTLQMINVSDNIFPLKYRIKNTIN